MSERYIFVFGLLLVGAESEPGLEGSRVEDRGGALEMQMRIERKANWAAVSMVRNPRRARVEWGARPYTYPNHAPTRACGVFVVRHVSSSGLSCMIISANRRIPFRLSPPDECVSAGGLLSIARSQQGPLNDRWLADAEMEMRVRLQVRWGREGTGH